jgi:hypothetical protein
MSDMGVQSMHQGWSFQDDANPRVAMTVDPPLMTLGQAKPTLQIEVVLDGFEFARTDEKARYEAEHDSGHVLTDRILRLLFETLSQRFELLLASRASLFTRFESRRYGRDVLDVGSERLLLGPDFVQSALDALGQTAELLLCEPPFFSSTLRWSEA